MIDLNKLHNFEFFKKTNLNGQLNKVEEEIAEVKTEFFRFEASGERKEELAIECFDLIMATLGLINHLNINQEEVYRKFISKLEKYKETKYKG